MRNSSFEGSSNGDSNNIGHVRTGYLLALVERLLPDFIPLTLGRSDNCCCCHSVYFDDCGSDNASNKAVM